MSALPGKTSGPNTASPHPASLVIGDSGEYPETEHAFTPVSAISEKKLAEFGPLLLA